MKSDFDARWNRLALAALDARDALRNAAPRISQAIERGCYDAETGMLLGELRGLAVKHADRLRLALKHPETE